MADTTEGLPSDIVQLAGEVVSELRGDTNDFYDSLNSRQQTAFSELGTACLEHVIHNPNAPNLLARLGPNEDAYSLTVAQLDGVLLRIHFYAAEGALVVNPNDMKNGVDVETFGTPHTHRGHISSVVPIGRLVHYCFGETEGAEYVAGSLHYEEAPGFPGNYRRTIITPQRHAGLDYLGAATFDNGNGYLMNKETVHVVSWPEPTVTVFLTDFTNPHLTTVYQPAGGNNEIERHRQALGPTERTHVWDTLSQLVSRELR